ncbi:MAG: hypothetical protein ACUVV6_00850 [Thermoplasmatota archaeon]
MGFVRNKPRRGKSKTMLNYYYLVENKWVRGESKQKVIKYLGTSPNSRELQIEPSVAGPIAQAILSGKTTPER